MVIIGIYGGEKMISAWWLIPALIVGAMFGIFAVAIVSNNKND